MTLEYTNGVWHRELPPRKWISKELNAGWNMPLIPALTPDKYKPFVGRLCTDNPAIAASLIWMMNSEAREAYHDSTAVPTSVSHAIPAPEGLEYMPHQAVAIKRFAHMKGKMLLGDEMGVGKTPTALGIINSSRRYKRILVFCPASLKINWFREACKWLVRPFNIHIFKGSSEPSKVYEEMDDLPEGNVLVICNYARAHRLYPWVMKGHGNKFDLVVCDEAHYLKNHESRRTKSICRTRDQYGEREGICDRSRHVLMMTGTPILNMASELFPLLHTLNPKLFPKRSDFINRYCPSRYFNGDVENLQLLLRSIMLRRLKSDVLTDLPDKTRRLVVMQANSRVRSLLAQEKQAFEEEYGASSDYENLAKALHKPKIGTLAELSRIRAELALAKAADAKTFIDLALEESNKIIVFAHHKALVKELEDYYAGECVSITGSTPQGKRAQAVDRFQTDDSVRVFIGNIRAAGTGLTLTASSRVIFCELDWTPANIQQAEDRAHRHGQKDNVLVDHLIYDGSIDSRMVELVIQKQRLIDEALGDSMQ